MKPIIIIIIVVIIGFLITAFTNFPENNQTPQPVEINPKGLHSSNYPFLGKLEFADYNELVRQCGLYNMPSTRELCYQGLEQDIEHAQLKTAVFQLSESKEYFMCHYLWNGINCLEQIAVKVNDPNACYEILKSPSETAREQKVGDKSYLEYRKEVCLNQLK